MTTTSINTIEAKEEFSDLLIRVSHHKERIILTRRGKEIAVLLPIEDWHSFQLTREKQKLSAAIEALKEAREQGTLTLQELKVQLGLT